MILEPFNPTSENQDGNDQCGHQQAPNIENGNEEEAQETVSLLSCDSTGEEKSGTTSNAIVVSNAGENMSSTIENGFHAGIDNDDYHATPEISSSNIKTALKSMGKYKAKLDGESVFKATPAMELGTLVHALVLEPHTFSDQFAVSEKFDGRTKVGKAAKAAFLAANEGKIIVDADQMKTASLMAKAVMEHEEVKLLFAVAGIAFEYSGFCYDPETELRVKYRPDIRTDHFIADLKTCADASKEEFARSISKFGYHVSAAHYLKCDRDLFGTTHGQFIFICVESTFPYEVAVYTLKSTAIDHGYDQCAKALSMIKDAQTTGNYPQLNDGLACEIDIPAWSYKD